MLLPVVGPIATIVTSDSDEPVFRVAAAAFFTPEGEKKINMLFLPDRALKRARIKLKYRGTTQLVQNLLLKLI